MWQGLSLFLLAILLPSARPQAFYPVPCTQTFDDFTKNLGVSCTSPCEVVCHAGCNVTFSATSVTGHLYYTTTTQICSAALYQGVTSLKAGGSFAIRSSGQMTGFVSGSSAVGEERSRSSDIPQPSWFIEPYERLRFVQEPEDTTVVLGKYLVLTCKVNTRSRATISWFNNNKMVQWSRTVDCKDEECHIQHAEKYHAGEWWCEATSDYSGTLVSRHVTVSVAYLNNTFRYQPRDGNRAFSKNGGTLTLLQYFKTTSVLPCSVDSQPPAQIVWYKNNRPLVERNAFKAQDGSLYFLTEEEKDSGSYKCTAHNPVTNETITSLTKRIQKRETARNVGSVASTIISSLSISPVYVRPGDSVTLTCVARGNPIPAISWSVPSSVAESGRTSTPFFGRNYVVANFRPSDAGRYTCNAVNDADYFGGAEFTSQVIPSMEPVFSIVPDDQTCTRGDRAELRCELQNVGNLGNVGTTDWLKDGEPVYTGDPRIKILESGFLVIERVVMEDAGMYQCVAIPNHAIQLDGFVRQSSARLSVLSGPQITLSDRAREDLLHNDGEFVRIRCTAAGFPYPYASWYKDGEPLLYDQRIRMEDVQTIVIDKADGLDNGNYMCVVRNSLGTVNLTRILTVNVKAHVVRLEASNRRGYYLAGEKILITCLAAGSRTSFDISWTKDNHSDLGVGVEEREEIDTDLHDYLVKRSILEIPVSTVDHEGNYRCGVKNYLRSSRDFRNLPIKVYPEAIPPRLESGPIHTVISEENNMLVQCTFSGAPPPWVTWKKNGQDIESDRISFVDSEDGLISTLVIKNAAKSDSGNYSCAGENSAGYTVTRVLPINIRYSDTGEVRNGTNSTKGLIFALPILFLWLLLV